MEFSAVMTALFYPFAAVISCASAEMRAVGLDSYASSYSRLAYPSLKMLSCMA